MADVGNMTQVLQTSKQTPNITLRDINSAEPENEGAGWMGWVWGWDVVRVGGWWVRGVFVRAVLLMHLLLMCVIMTDGTMGVFLIGIAFFLLTFCSIGFHIFAPGFHMNAHSKLGIARFDVKISIQMAGGCLSS